MRHLFCTLKARRVRGRNTENNSIEKDEEVTKHQGKQHVILKFVHDEKHIVFNDIGVDKKKKEVYDGVQVLVAIGD